MSSGVIEDPLLPLLLEGTDNFLNEFLNEFLKESLNFLNDILLELLPRLYGHKITLLQNALKVRIKLTFKYITFDFTL